MNDHPQTSPPLSIDAPLRSVLTDSNVVLFTQDHDLRYTWIFNPQLDYASDEVVGKRDEDLFTAADAAVLSAIKQKVLDTGEPARETVGVTDHGNLTYYDLVVDPMRDPSGAVVGVTCAATDITAHRAQTDEHRFRTTVLESIYDSVIATDFEGRITYWNRGAEDTFGYRADEMLGQSIARLYPADGADGVQADLKEIEAGHDYYGEWRGVRRDGTPVWLDIRTTALRDSAGNCIGFVGVSKDITSRRHAEQERDRLLAHERSSKRHLRQFLALVAHDLRNSLAVQSGYTQLLRRRTMALDSDGYASAIDALDDATSMMKRLVDDLGDAAAVGEGRFIFQPARMDLISLAEEVVTDCQASTSRHDLMLNGPSEIHGNWDAQRLRQLLANLVDNAIKYSPQGGEILVSVRNEGDLAILSVQDQGIGIADEEQDHLFDLFARSERSVDVAGFGLGLYICRAIAEAHGGRITVDSTPGQGSTFSVALPCGQREHYGVS